LSLHSCKEKRKTGFRLRLAWDKPKSLDRGYVEVKKRKPKMRMD